MCVCVRIYLSWFLALEMCRRIGIFFTPMNKTIKTTKLPTWEIGKRTTGNVPEQHKQ